MKNNHFNNIIILAVITAMVTLSCKKDDPPAAGTPAWKIMEQGLNGPLLQQTPSLPSISLRKKRPRRMLTVSHACN
jgi:hypothetical protein